jgi:hypothetical protein
MAVISRECSDFLNVPDPAAMLAGAIIQGLAGFWIAKIGQLPITVDAVVTTPLQFIADRGFTGAGNALY